MLRMDTQNQNSSLFNTHLGFFNLGYFISPKMSSFFAYFFTLFAFVKQGFFRMKEKFIPHKQNSNSVLIPPREEGERKKTLANMVAEGETESFLSFRFRRYEEFIGNDDEKLIEEEQLLSLNNQVSEDDFDDEFFDVENEEDDAVIASSSHDSSHVEEIEQPQISSEINHGDNSDHINGNQEPETNTEVVGSSDNSVLVAKTEENCTKISSETQNFLKNVVNDSVVAEAAENPDESRVQNGQMFSDDEDDDESLVSNSDSDSMVSSSRFSIRSSVVDWMGDEFLSDIDFERAFEVDNSMEFVGKEPYSGKKFMTEEDIELANLNRGYQTDDFEDEDEEILKELKRLELEEKPQNQAQPPKRRVSFKEPEPEDKSNDEKPESGEQSGEKSSSGEQLSFDSEEQNELERQWEHQDLVEQLKMEIKKVRSIGLPTILEESESPKIIEDLKPWKIEEKFHHEDTMDELHKFYKIYRERMRKMDILNYQKMYAIGFLRQKDPLHSLTKNKLSTPAMAAIVSLDCLSCKGKSSTEAEQPVMKKFSRELESDLEMVYVGQMCLSWEFLRWEYGKALKLWDSDLHMIRRYNEVADKFQQFQVLLTRFLEDEPYQGPRVQHFVKNRCVFRNLLQVPVIREDNMRDIKKERKWASRKNAVTSVKLVEMIEESIRILWQFIRSDKASSNPILAKCGRGSNLELQNPADAVLLDQIQSTLHKKEKKLKEVTRSGKYSILRKLQKHHDSEDEDHGSDHAQYFFSEVDLKLVSRVLNMSKITTEQLGWCSEKLNKINFVGGKLYVDSSCLLFPCS